MTAPGAGSGEIAEVDVRHLAALRENVSRFVAECGRRYDGPDRLVLDVAPQDHEGAAPYFAQATVETLDIHPDSGADYVADLCANNEAVIPSGRFDCVVCTEVLEHTLQPFDAVDEIERVLKPGGVALVSTPFDFRIHGPLPDCWRFTEHGLRALFKNFDIVELTPLENPERFLMPT
ncbi:MAG TPA: methyltransferase domain-containing protein, partial [Acidimicrobiia bacterium]|nr:methyltransferase domain-containing protein [Acidimicrobiia bacterium]